MTVEQLIGKVYNRLKDRDFSGTQDKLAIQVNLTGKITGVFYIEVLGGVLSVMPYEYLDRDAAISLTMTNFDRILSGKLNPQVAFAEGKLKVEGNIDKVLLLAELLKN
ncbi:SCP2 sterol-binding domain-containing protein [Intestinibacillus sp. Marseille-P6563]|uniref:SCP2 sterol-binding domain-containing protein n=1 Tax=Intestinibacillus sp. Marseille-P6563 TaxID=2364792 RepID=UPI000F05BA37|nr:SCP2 sterol-binding domain-containing protein [Intestinibacillus sp. Marseille-P6563]